jgi:2-C-methyl-D-erythritol 4-phosphate cytidylyltransferase
VTDSLHRVGGDGSFSKAVPRDGLRAVQTPQAARSDLLRRAFAEAERNGREATDEVSLLLAAEVPVTAVDGDAENVKITTPDDWRAAEAILDRRAAGAR